MKIPVLVTAALLAALTAVPAMAAPRPPEQMRLRAHENEMEIHWLKSPDDPLLVSGYEVVRGVFAAGPYHTVCVTLKGATSCRDRRTDRGKTYFYRIRALGIGDEGPSEYTYEASAETPPLPPAPRPEP